MILASLVALIAALQPGLPPTLVNPGFEASEPDDSMYGAAEIPGWRVLPARGYRAAVAARGERFVGGPVEPGRYLFMGYFARNGPTRGSFIAVYQAIDARRWRGRRIRVSVAANPAHFAANRAWLIVRSGGSTARRNFDQVERWVRYAVEIDVPQRARSVTIEIGTNGDVSVDDVRVERVRR